ncbi:MAG: hypothetical protein WCL34_14490 [Methylococcaceae bacterium]
MQNDLLKNLSPGELKAKQEQILALVPVTGGIGNGALKQALKDKFGQYWSGDLYWAVRNNLIERGILEKGRGNGGSVKKVIQSNELTDNAVVAQNYGRENELYKPMKTVLENDWARDQTFNDCYVAITAQGGARPTNGKWTRPDITVIGCKTFLYVPGKHLEVVTFEVKPANAIDISGVYEALAHRRAANRSYLIVHVPTAADLCLFNDTDIVEEAGKFGIGVIVAQDPKEYETWVVKLEAQRIEPNPYKLNEFIAQQISAEVKEQIAAWVKS